MSRVFLVAVLTVAEASAQFESGAVIRSNGDQFYRNTIPQVATLNDGRVFTVWSAVGKTDTLGNFRLRPIAPYLTGAIAYSISSTVVPPQSLAYLPPYARGAGYSAGILAGPNDRCSRSENGLHA